MVYQLSKQRIMRTSEINIPTFRGEELTAWLDRPAGGNPQAYALFAYCFSGRQQEAVENISLALTQKNIAVLRFDFTYTQNSGGLGIASADDLLAAARYLQKEYQGPSLIVGHSLAGAAAIIIASEIPSLKAVATIGAPAHEKYLRAILDEDMHDEDFAEIVYSDTHDFKVDLELLDAMDEKRMHKKVNELDMALLLLHSPQDTLIYNDSAAELYTAARHPKSFISLDGADHFLSKAADSWYCGNMIAAWVQRYLDLEEPAALRTHMEVVTRTGKEGFTTEIRAGNHSLLADEPAKFGGADLGPNPYDLLNAALGACTSMTIQMYARRKKWPLEEAIVHLKHNQVYGEDCAVCDEKKSRLDQLSREVELKGNLDEGQRARLMEIADKCPVHKTLMSDISITTKELKR